jgi:membrane protein
MDRGADRTAKRADVERGRRLGALVERHEGTLVLRVFRRMIAINGYDRALALSAQAFVGVIPMLVIVSALLPDPIRRSTGPALLASLGLSGDAAAALSALAHPPPGVETITVLGGVLLVLSVLGFTRALQRTYLAAWGLPSSGLRGYALGLLSSVALVCGLAAIVVLGPAVSALDDHVLLKLVINAVAAILLWWPVQRVLLGSATSWRALFPGAVLNGVGQALVFTLSGLYMPAVISHEAAEYGLVGIAVAVVSWLVIVGLLLVLSAVFGAELAREPTGPETPP